MQRDDMLGKVEAAYQARRTGNFEALSEIVADGASFAYAGEESLLAGLPGTGGVSVHEAAQQLFKSIDLRSLERVDAVAENNRVAILWKGTFVVSGGPPFESLMFDLWEFDDSGKISKGTQFIDTAKFVEVMR